MASVKGNGKRKDSANVGNDREVMDMENVEQMTVTVKSVWLLAKTFG